MTAEGRLSRGKENYEAKKFLDNPETLAYMATLKESKEEVKEKPKEEVKEKPKEEVNESGESKSR